jgi:hypothetical protein
VNLGRPNPLPPDRLSRVSFVRAEQTAKALPAPDPKPAAALAPHEPPQRRLRLRTDDLAPLPTPSARTPALRQRISDKTTADLMSPLHRLQLPSTTVTSIEENGQTEDRESNASVPGSPLASLRLTAPAVAHSVALAPRSAVAGKLGGVGPPAASKFGMESVQEIFLAPPSSPTKAQAMRTLPPARLLLAQDSKTPRSARSPQAFTAVSPNSADAAEFAAATSDHSVVQEEWIVPSQRVLKPMEERAVSLASVASVMQMVRALHTQLACMQGTWGGGLLGRGTPLRLVPDESCAQALHRCCFPRIL